MYCNHKQKYTQVGKYAGNVDKGIMPLIKAIWKIPVGVEYSCEAVRNDGIMIRFCCPHCADGFLDAIEKMDNHTAGSLYHRAVCDDNTCPNNWYFQQLLYQINPLDVGAKPIYSGSVVYIFPKSDYPEVLRRVQAYQIAPSFNKGVVSSSRGKGGCHV